MPLHSSSNKSYINLHDPQHDARASTPWYWRFIALAASWMILGGYLMLPGLYAKDPELKFGQSVLSAFVVALLTAGYSFTALLCFACRNEAFQAEGIFLPALQSSALGLLTIAYNFLISRAYLWNTPAITGTVVSTSSTLLYGALLLWTHRRIVKLNEASSSRTPNALWSEPSWYDHYNANMYPTVTGASSASRASYSPPVLEGGYAGAGSGTYATAAYTPDSASLAPPHRTPQLQIQHQLPTHSRPHSRTHSRQLSEDDRINQQMALLLAKQSDAGPSPDAASSTFKIDLPGRGDGDDDDDDDDEEKELAGSPAPVRASLQAADQGRGRSRSGGGVRQSLSEEEAWRRWDRGRTREVSTSSRTTAGHSRAVSREERRREIEMGGV